MGMRLFYSTKISTSRKNMLESSRPQDPRLQRAMANIEAVCFLGETIWDALEIARAGDPDPVWDKAAHILHAKSAGDE